MLAADAAEPLRPRPQGPRLRDLRRFDEAEAVADRLLADDPSDLKAAYLKVTIAEPRRDFAKAATLLEEILARPPADGEEGSGNQRVFLVHLGFAYQQLGRYADAAEAFAPRDRGAATRPTPTC